MVNGLFQLFLWYLLDVLFFVLQLDTTNSLECRILFSKIWSIIILNLEHFSSEDGTLFLDARIYALPNTNKMFYLHDKNVH